MIEAKQALGGLRAGTAYAPVRTELARSVSLPSGNWHLSNLSSGLCDAGSRVGLLGSLRSGETVMSYLSTLCTNIPMVRTKMLQDFMERETGIEPATSSLGSWRSTAELLPLAESKPSLALDHD
jgi:hypothetical protein